MLECLLDDPDYPEWRGGDQAGYVEHGFSFRYPLEKAMVSQRIVCRSAKSLPTAACGCRVVLASYCF